MIKLRSGRVITVESAWNSGMAEEEIIKNYGQKEFDRLKKRYGVESIPLYDLLGLKDREPADPRVRHHRGLDGPGLVLKKLIEESNSCRETAG